MTALGDPRIPRLAALAVGTYLNLADKILPDLVEGFIITGSIAMGAWEAPLSDLDFLAVTAAPLRENQAAALKSLHDRLRRRKEFPAFCGSYITWAQLRADPRGIVAPRVREGVFIERDSYAANPVAWIIVARHPLVVRGPSSPEAWEDEAALKSWCLENGRSYWAGLARRGRKPNLGALYFLTRESASWSVLGLARIHHTIETGAIISKREGAQWAISRFGPEWQDIVDEARAYRERRRSPLSLRPVKRRNRTLDFMDCVLADLDRK